MTALLSWETSSAPSPRATGLLDGGAVDTLEVLLQRDRFSEAEVAVSLRVIRQSINQLQALESKVISAAQHAEIGAADGLDNAAWIARESRQGGAAAARSGQLARSLPALPRAGQALGEGLISVQHALVIATAATQLPPDLTPRERDRVESDLTEQAKTVDPATLRKASRRAVQIAGRSITEADAHENQVLTTLEEAALAKTRLSIHDNYDGTISGHFTVPAFAGNVLRKVVQQITAPRRQALRAAHDNNRSWTRPKDFDADWAHQYGLALVELLEHLPTTISTAKSQPP